MPEEQVRGGDVVTVIYALSESQHIAEVECAVGLSASEAVERSGLATRFPEIRDRPLVLGLFGRRIDPQTPVRPGDRVEICRPLLRDPRELRRYMTAQGRVIGQRDSSGETVE
jgi:putative ubiquitin-RnfH superfamily antitoxin RatB of RatAB toxin-antitoxin module